MPISWNISSLGESTEMGAGGDKPKLTSPIKTEECPYPIFSNGLSDYGLRVATNEAKIHAESVTVSARDNRLRVPASYSVCANRETCDADSKTRIGER